MVIFRNIRQWLLSSSTIVGIWDALLSSTEIMTHSPINEFSHIMIPACLFSRHLPSKSYAPHSAPKGLFLAILSQDLRRSGRLPARIHVPTTGHMCWPSVLGTSCTICRYPKLIHRFPEGTICYTDAICVQKVRVIFEHLHRRKDEGRRRC